jgi:hypothetical protein
VTPEFEDLIGGDLAPRERERLRRAHDLLVAAGPPPELPPSLENPPVRATRSEIAYFPRRRWAAVAVAAAAAAAAAFGGGYLVGHNGGGNGAFAAPRIVKMHRTAAAPAGAQASLKLGQRDAAGNWPMLVSVSNLRELRKGGYYDLYLTRHGRPIAPCGSFVFRGDRTTLQFTEPYELARFDGWVVTEQPPGQHEPGRVVLTT